MIHITCDKCGFPILYNKISIGPLTITHQKECSMCQLLKNYKHRITIDGRFLSQYHPHHDTISITVELLNKYGNLSIATIYGLTRCITIKDHDGKILKKVFLRGVVHNENRH